MVFLAFATQQDNVMLKKLLLASSSNDKYIKRESQFSSPALVGLQK